MVGIWIACANEAGGRCGRTWGGGSLGFMWYVFGVFCGRCPCCLKSYPYSRAREAHQCFEVRCYVCNEWVRSNHLCYIQPTEARGVLSRKIRFFDFEADPNGPQGYHVPNYAAVSSDGVEFTIYHDHGRSIIEAFCDGEFCEANQGTTYIAHHAKGYDAHFIKQYLSTRGMRYDYIPKGHKIMELRIKGLNIRIVDSVNFIPAPLAAFPKMFGLEGARKGVYPYEFNTAANWDYDGPMPALQSFLPGGQQGTLYVDGEEQRRAFSREDMRDDEKALQARRDEIVVWWKTRVREGNRWNNFDELDAYCKNDVTLLAQGCLEFQKNFMAMTESSAWNKPNEDDEKKMGVSRGVCFTREAWAISSLKTIRETYTCLWCDYIGVDPFSYVTIASASMATLKHKFLKRDQIAYIPRYSRRSIHEMIQWFGFLESTTRAHIRHAYQGGEVRCVGYQVSGYDAASGTIYDFHDCYLDGCRSCFPERGTAFQRQVHRKTLFETQGYIVVDIWLCEFQHLKYTSPVFRSFLDEYIEPWASPLNVRHAFYGGRTNATCLYYRCPDDDTERIEYVDFTSLYPYINKYGEYPVGHPQVIRNPSLEALHRREYFGLVKCRVVPPRGLIHPVLPVRYHQKLMFPLCRMCMETASTRCEHEGRARSFQGVWCTPEIYRAMDEGYQVTAIREVHHFRETIQGLFSAYVDTFLQAKQESSGWPKVMFTAFRLSIFPWFTQSFTTTFYFFLDFDGAPDAGAPDALHNIRDCEDASRCNAFDMRDSSWTGQHVVRYHFRETGAVAYAP